MAIYRAKKGFTSAYIAAAIAVAATAGIGGVDIFKQGVQDSYVLTETQQGGQIRNGIQSMFHADGYAELSNKIMRRSNHMPVNKLRAEGDMLKTQWAEDGLVLTPEAKDGSSLGSWFGMTYKSLPQHACVGMSQNYDNFEKVEINGVPLYTAETDLSSDIEQSDIESLCDLEEGNQVKWYSR